MILDQRDGFVILTSKEKLPQPKGRSKCYVMCIAEEK